MRKYPKKLKAECLKLFLEGKTLKEISKLKDVPFLTISSWHNRYEWAKNREDNAIKVQENVQILVSENKAKAEFDVRQKLIDGMYNVEAVINRMLGLDVDVKFQHLHEEQIRLNPGHLAILYSVFQKMGLTIAQIDGLIVDKHKVEGNINFGEAVAKILSYRSKRVHSDNPPIRLLPGQKG